jgi:transposase
MDTASGGVSDIPPLWTPVWCRGMMGTPRRPYRTDLSDARWALIEPMLSAWRASRVGLGISPIQHDLREIVNAILYVNRTGIAWEYLPHDFPPFKTVHGYFALWEKEGLTEAIHDALRGKVHPQTHRRARNHRHLTPEGLTPRTTGHRPTAGGGSYAVELCTQPVSIRTLNL